MDKTVFTVIIWLDTGVLLRIYPRLFFTEIILTEYIGIIQGGMKWGKNESSVHGLFSLK